MDREKARERSRRWRQRHPGAVAADSRRRRKAVYAKAAKGDVSAAAKREAERDRSRAWRTANREAMRAAVRSWQSNNKEAAALASRRWSLKRRYGISLEEFSAMAEAQGGRCAICDDPPAPGMNLSVDHDHGSGAVRKLLCSPCNLAVGLLRERPELAVNVAEYLRAHGR